MGSGSSKPLAAAVKKCSEDDLKAVFIAWPEDQRAKLDRLLSEPDEKNPKNDEQVPAVPAIKISGSSEASPATTKVPTPDQDEAPPAITISVAAQKVPGAVEEATASSSAPAAKEPPVATKSLDEAQTAKVHSAIRWGKAEAEIEAVVTGLGIDATLIDAVAAVDAKNGNRALHISAQNGHVALTKLLLQKGFADPNQQNFKGQTPMHMSVEYDFYFQTKILLEARADPNIANGDGHSACLGIDGGKVDADAWDSPLNILKAAGDVKEELDLAFEKLLAADPKDLDRAAIAQAGMKKKKLCPNHWDADRFKQLMQKL